MKDAGPKGALLLAVLSIVGTLAWQVYVGAECSSDCSRWYCGQDTRCMGAR